jgi:hypothetical protein
MTNRFRIRRIPSKLRDRETLLSTLKLSAPEKTEHLFKLVDPLKSLALLHEGIETYISLWPYHTIELKA